MSSGTFEQVKELLEAHPDAAASEDLSGDVLLMLSSLMLAQAQELFYIMSLKTNMQATAVSKLAAQAHDFYSTTVDLMSGGSLKSKLPKKWIPHAELKRDAMKAVAHYQLGRHIRQAKLATYGEELSRYKVAAKCMAAAAKHKSTLPELAPFFDDLNNRIISALNSAQKDNDTIYHESIIPEHKLPLLEKKVMVKAERLPDDKLTISPNTDPFTKLIPFKARKADSIYSERKAQVIRTIGTYIEEANAVVKKALHDMGLPGALEALETPHGIPQSLMQKMEAVRRQGGVIFLREQHEVLKKMFKEDNSILETAFHLLDDEEKEDIEMRKQYGERWNRTPSHTLTANLRVEGQKYKSNLDHANKSDAYIEKLTNENERSIEILAGDQGQVLNMLPETARQEVSVTKLKELCKELDELIYNRDNALAKFRDIVNKDDITDKLVKAQEFEYETVFSKELSKFDDNIAELKKLIAPQEQILNSIKEENEKFAQHRRANTQLQHRQQVLQDFESAYNNYSQIKDHLSEGIQFYTNFQDILRKFKDKCSDLVFARKTEKQDLLQDIQAQVSGYTVTTYTTPQGVPPPYVIPPHAQSQTQQQMRGMPHPQQQYKPYQPVPPQQQYFVHPQTNQPQYYNPPPYHQPQPQQNRPVFSQTQQKPSAFPKDPYSNLDNYPPGSGY